jgi:hypothetical protein
LQEISIKEKNDQITEIKEKSVNENTNFYESTKTLQIEKDEYISK